MTGADKAAASRHGEGGEARGRDYSLPRRRSCSLQEWVRARVREEDRGHTTPCWIWRYTIAHNGYGRTRVATDFGRQTMAHRVAYIAASGPIPSGHEIDHLCSVRACCNPAHLEAVTKLENVRRALPMQRLAMLAQRKSHCVRGHELAPGNLIIDYRGMRRCRACKLNDRRTYRQKEKAA